ncbi:MAG: ClpXP adapter SpxH family protein [Tenuifilaceae bacterium]|nr:ClpXP adapter SpxH family protein [Tenuifilaceae bacterium]
MNKKTTKDNPLICDIETGMCENTSNEAKDSTAKMAQTDINKVRLIYFTDPICSSCWGIEPQLRKLKLEYGEHIDIEYRMGGLLPDWNYNSGGISKPADVAEHWDEVSVYYDMPIDGDLWLEDPLNSSYPPSIAFKAAQLQDEDKAVLFMREMREMMFLKKKNLAKWEHIATAAESVGLNVEQLKSDFEGKAKILFEEDLKIAREYGVRGFPTIYLVNNDGNKEVVYGSKPYALYEAAILKLDATIIKSEYSKSWETLFSKYASLTAKEFSVLSGTPRNESEDLLNKLSDDGKLEKTTTKNGSIWLTK